MKKITFTLLVLLLVVGTSLAQTAHQKKERILDHKDIQNQPDRESLRNPVQITGSSRSNGLCTVLFSWTGDAGYTMSATMTYDPSQADAGVVGAEGTNRGDFNNGVIDLVVSFFDPSGLPMGTIVNVENGVVLYTSWLAVFFNIDTEEFFGFFDVGQFFGSPVIGDSNLNLVGIIGVEYEFFDGTFPPNLDESDDDFVIVVDDVSCQEPLALPISSIALLAFLLPMLGFVFFRSRSVQA